MLNGTQIYLRALEPEDLEFVHSCENDMNLWEVSQAQTPYSKFIIRQYLENAQEDIYTAKQLRLAICELNNPSAIGLIDLFEFEPNHSRAGIGILLKAENHRNSGFGSEALELLIDYCKTHLGIRCLWANIDPENKASISLFTKFGFELIGVKKQWNRRGNSYKDEAFFQLIHQ